MFAPSRAAIAFVLCAAALCGPPAAAREGGLPRLYTNEQAIEDARHPPTVDIDDLKAVLRFVLAALPDRVKVYPTENYYYFFFYEGGVKYAGNFRFDVGKRDEGFVEFIYFRDTTEWEDDDRDYHARLGPAAGPFMGELLRTRRLVDWLLRIAGMTIVAGGFLYWHDQQVYGGLGDFLGTAFGDTMTAGAIFALIAFGIGLFATKPTLQKGFDVGAKIARQWTDHLGPVL